jgi:ribokinase
MGKAKVVVLGSFVVDLTSRGPHLPVPGETVKGTSFKMGPGGKGSNQGVAAQRAGAEVTMITKVGKDPFAKIALDNFKRENMDTRFVFEDDSHETGTALIMVDEQTGQNQILVVTGACNYITDENLNAARESIEKADIFITQLETNLDAVEKGIDMAYARGVRVVLNPAPAQQLPDDIYKKLYCITPNETEASILTGVDVKSMDDVKKAAEILLKKGTANVVITLGDKGSYATDGKEELFISPIPVEPVETTGAGDAFNGAFAAALAEGMDFFTAARFANVAGGLSVTRLGTAPAMPYRDEIEKYSSYFR